MKSWFPKLTAFLKTKPAGLDYSWGKMLLWLLIFLIFLGLLGLVGSLD